VIAYADAMSIGVLADSNRLGADAARRFLDLLERQIDALVTAAPPTTVAPRPADALPAHALE
jgi:hypothetical protein